MTTPKRLGAFVDGAALPDDDAHALWDRFSLWMDEHRGDLAGFATAEGFVSIQPGVDGDRPVLRASTTAPQTPYASVKEQKDHKDPRRSGGSQSRQGGSPHPDQRNRAGGNSPRKPQR